MEQEKVRVIVDSRDASQDLYITEEEAKKLFDKGEIVMDLTNDCYAIL